MRCAGRKRGVLGSSLACLHVVLVGACSARLPCAIVDGATVVWATIAMMRTACGIRERGT